MRELHRWRPFYMHSNVSEIDIPNTNRNHLPDIIHPQIVKPRSLPVLLFPHVLPFTVSIQMLGLHPQPASTPSNMNIVNSFRYIAREGKDGWVLQDGLPLKANRLFIPDDDPALYNYLMKCTHKCQPWLHVILDHQIATSNCFPSNSRAATRQNPPIRIVTALNKEAEK